MFYFLAIQIIMIFDFSGFLARRLAQPRLFSNPDNSTLSSQTGQK